MWNSIFYHSHLNYQVKLKVMQFLISLQSTTTNEPDWLMSTTRRMWTPWVSHNLFFWAVPQDLCWWSGPQNFQVLSPPLRNTWAEWWIYGLSCFCEKNVSFLHCQSFEMVHVVNDDRLPQIMNDLLTIFPNSCFSITNLKYWGHCEQILTRTLTLLSDLSISYNSVRKLVKLEEVQFMLNNHTVSKIICLRARLFFYVISSNLWICETDVILCTRGSRAKWLYLTLIIHLCLSVVNGFEDYSLFK